MPQDAAMIAFGVASSIRTASSFAAKPPKTTEWIAPSRAQASIASSASGIIEEGVDTGGAAAVTAILVGVPTLLVVLLDGPVLVRRRGTGVSILHWVLGLGLAAWSALMVFTVAATACDSSCTTVPEGPVRAAVGVASLVLALGGTLVGLLARHPSRT